MELIERLSREIGPRRPTSEAEARAVRLLVERLRAAGAEARSEPFDAYPTFAYPVGALLALALLPGLLPRRHRVLRSTLSAGAAGLLLAEGRLGRAPVSEVFATRESANVVASVEPRGDLRRTLCLLAHCDTSRSGLLFHPALGPHLQAMFAAPTLAAVALALAAPFEGSRPVRRLSRGMRVGLAAGLGLLVERELRGVDVAGANDNASGAAAVVQLAAEVAAQPLEATRLMILVTGAEEAGVLGARAFLDAHDTRGWLFVNFDGVGAPGSLRYLPREGLGRTWPADAGLLALAARIRARHPELGFEPADGPLGLIYDTTVVLARGGRALSLVAGDRGRIPNYHRPTDTFENINPQAVERALLVGRELIEMVDRGEAD